MLLMVFKKGQQKKRSSANGIVLNARSVVNAQLLAVRLMALERKQTALRCCWLVSQLVSWCFEPSQPQRITSGLNTNFTLSPSHSFLKLSYHKTSVVFFSLFIFREHSAWEPASSRVTCFILRVYTGTGVSHSQDRKKSGEVLDKMQVNRPEGQK